MEETARTLVSRGKPRASCLAFAFCAGLGAFGSSTRIGALALLVCLGAMPFGKAVAEEASRPLEFEVRPSGVIAETPDERLDRRLKQREHLFRSICTHCGPGDRFSSTAPFKPFEALAVPAPRSEQN